MSEWNLILYCLHSYKYWSACHFYSNIPKHTQSLYYLKGGGTKNQTKRVAKNTYSIDKPVSDDNSRTLADILPDPGGSLDDLIDSKIFKQQIIESFGSLSKREELILRMRFGISEILPNDKNVYDIKEEK